MGVGNTDDSGVIGQRSTVKILRLGDNTRGPFGNGLADKPVTVGCLASESKEQFAGIQRSAVNGDPDKGLPGPVNGQETTAGCFRQLLKAQTNQFSSSVPDWLNPIFARTALASSRSLKGYR